MIGLNWMFVLLLIAEYNCNGFLAVKVPKDKITCPLRLILEIYEKEYHLTSNNVGKAWIANDEMNMFSSGSFVSDSTGSVLEGSDLIAIDPFEFDHGSVVIRGSMTSPWSVKAASEFNSYGFNYSKKLLSSGFNDNYSNDLTLKEDWLNGNVVFTHSKEEYNSNSIYHLAYSRKATSRVIHKIASENEYLTNEYLNLNRDLKFLFNCLIGIDAEKLQKYISTSLNLPHKYIIVL